MSFKIRNQCTKFQEIKPRLSHEAKIVRKREKVKRNCAH